MASAADPELEEFRACVLLRDPATPEGPGRPPSGNRSEDDHGKNPDARWGHKSKEKRFLGYKTHESMDPDSRMITAVDVVPGNANEAVRTDALLEQETVPLEEQAAVIGDGLYANATTVAQVKRDRRRPCFSGLEAPRISDRFDYDVEHDQMVCAEGKRSIGKVRVPGGELYYYSVKDCRGCGRREACLTQAERKGQTVPRRRVYLSDVRKRRVELCQAGQAWRQQQLRVRRRIESKFAEQMNRHGLRRARYWGLAKVTVQVLLNVITVNLKRAVKLLAGTQGVPPRTRNVVFAIP